MNISIICYKNFIFIKFFNIRQITVFTSLYSIEFATKSTIYCVLEEIKILIIKINNKYFIKLKQKERIVSVIIILNILFTVTYLSFTISITRHVFNRILWSFPIFVVSRIWFVERTILYARIVKRTNDVQFADVRENFPWRDFFGPFLSHQI